MAEPTRRSSKQVSQYFSKVNPSMLIGGIAATAVVGGYGLYRWCKSANTISDDKYPLISKKLEDLTIVGRPADEIAMDDFPVLVSEMRRVFQSNLTRPLAKRREQLEAMLRMVTENEGKILDAVKSDLHKEGLEAYADVFLPTHSIKNMLKNLEKFNAAENAGFSLLTLPSTNTIVKEPYGTVLIHGIWNYPFQLVFCPLAGAIAAGNNVVIMPCKTAPASCQLICDLVHQYLDPRVVQVCGGTSMEDDRVASDRLTNNQFDMIFFTGSSNGGRWIMGKAAQFLTPVVLELGGKNPVFVDSSADIDSTARQLWTGRVPNCGQACVSADYVLVERGMMDGIIERLKFWKQKLYPDYENDLDQGRLITDAQYQRVAAMIESTRGEIVIGGDSNAQTRHFEPTAVLLDGLPAPHEERDPGLVKETFGPVLWLVPIDSMEEGVEYVRLQPKSLSLYIFSTNQNNIDYIVANTSSGGVMVNGARSYVLHDGIPFGGVGASGMGAYHGKLTYDAFCHRKGVVQKWNFEMPGSGDMLPPTKQKAIDTFRKVL